tara:strand:- start:487 stop:978 length:492 start_codon:yes stop_codon:yes gene_type:complete
VFNVPPNENFFISDKVEIKEIEGKGLGIVAKEAIKKGTIIESSHVLLFPNTILKDFDQMYGYMHPLHSYVFTWDSGKCAVAFGFGSIYNHSNDNNAAWRPSYLFLKNKEPERIHYVAVKDIQQGEEVCIHYAPSAGDLFFGEDGTFHRDGAVTDNEISKFRRI